MNSRLILPILLLNAIAGPATHAAIVYSSFQNIAIPLDFEGEYLRPDTGQSTQTVPIDWASAPWINPFFGGVDIANSPLLRPVIHNGDQITNLDAGASITVASDYAIGESGSSTHVGADPGQFALNVPGYIGFAFRTTADGPDHYGWMELQINNTGPGQIISWAYEDTAGTGIQAGAVPEPSTITLFGMAVFGFSVWRRRKHALGSMRTTGNRWQELLFLRSGRRIFLCKGSTDDS